MQDFLHEYLNIHTEDKKKSLKRVEVYTYSPKTSQKQANIGLEYQ